MVRIQVKLSSGDSDAQSLFHGVAALELLRHCADVTLLSRQQKSVIECCCLRHLQSSADTSLSLGDAFYAEAVLIVST